MLHGRLSPAVDELIRSRTLLSAVAVVGAYSCATRLLETSRKLGTESCDSPDQTSVGATAAYAEIEGNG